MSYNEQTSIINFTNENDYTFNPYVVDVSSGSVELAITNAPNQHFPIDFSSDSGFTYDSDYIEFGSGEAKQVDKRPVNSIVGATFTDSIDASFATDGFVSKTAILNGTPSIVSNKVSCIGSNGLSYQDTLIAGLQGDWVAKFKYTPNYTTAPATNVNIFAISQATGGSDDIIIFNSPSGGSGIRITANGLAAVTFGAFAPVTDQDYTFEIFCVSNVVTVFIDGVQVGTGQTISPGQGTSSNTAHLGAYSTAYNTSDGSFSDFILYSTASQTTTYDVPESAYLGSTLTTPELEYTGVGALISFDTFTTVESGSLRYTLQVGRSGDYLYWNSSDWVASDGSYAQATDVITFNNNCPAISVSGEVYGQFKIHFTDSDTQQSIDNLEAILTAQTYSTTNPAILVNEVFNADLLVSLTETASIPSGCQIKAIIKIDSEWYWYNTSTGAWGLSDQTYTQSNTISEINSYIADLIDTRKSIQFQLFLNSDGLSTPTINQLDFTYSFASSTEDSIDICSVHFIALNVQGIPCSNTYKAKLNKDNVQYKTQTSLCFNAIEIVPSSEDGYVQFNLIPSVDMSVDGYTGDIYYKITKIDTDGNESKVADILVPSTNSEIMWNILR